MLNFTHTYAKSYKLINLSYEDLVHSCSLIGCNNTYTQFIMTKLSITYWLMHKNAAQRSGLSLTRVMSWPLHL
jgi:hypothetical protein